MVKLPETSQLDDIMIFINILFILFAPISAAITSAPYWGLTSGIQTYQVVLLSGSNWGAFTSSPSYTSYFNRTYLSTDVPRHVVAVNYHQWYYYYYQYTLSSSVTYQYVSFTFSFVDTTYTFYVTVMLYDNALYPTIQNTFYSVTSGSMYA